LNLNSLKLVLEAVKLWGKRNCSFLYVQLNFKMLDYIFYTEIMNNFIKINGSRIFYNKLKNLIWKKYLKKY